MKLGPISLLTCSPVSVELVEWIDCHLHTLSVYIHHSVHFRRYWVGGHSLVLTVNKEMQYTSTGPHHTQCITCNKKKIKCRAYFAAKFSFINKVIFLILKKSLILKSAILKIAKTIHNFNKIMLAIKRGC